MIQDSRPVVTLILVVEADNSMSSDEVLDICAEAIRRAADGALDVHFGSVTEGVTATAKRAGADPSSWY